MGPAEILERALAYPFPRPPGSVLIEGGRVRELRDLEPALFAGRNPVLAYGSNASPESLGWKFPDERDAVLPLVRGALRGFDVVYSSHIAVYGSVPATLQASEGTSVETFVAFLTDSQLALVEGWEINATYERLHVDLELEVGDPPPAVGAFVSRHGCLAARGAEIALAEVPARGRRFAAMTQPEALEFARATAAPELSLEDFVVGNVRDYARARELTALLPALPFARDGAGPSRRGDSNP
ncbi:MAG TPA: hypothetical protein VJT75_01050 [Thermoleophilaceae bacterium]|nr:hypothetical protein [Thermoleophilaceae bacterium]